MVLEDTLISIHALREEGDHLAAAVANELINFNPRPPRGGRLGRIPLRDKATGFQSTPSARRATEHAVRRNGRKEISIHALREEGDHGPGHRRSLPPDFNPRPPRGGRPSAAFSARFRSLFQSTPSARRATDGFQLGGPALEISIHALREEGDLQSGMWSMANTIFQSTPSARRATHIPRLDVLTNYISIHALREEGDTKR